MKISCVDMYCGIGGLTSGLEASGINVVAGIDFDESCKWSYEKNTHAKFLHQNLDNVNPAEIAELFPEGSIRLLAGCAPCQPFSNYGRTRKGKDNRWRLLGAFTEAVRSFKPELVTMENVPGLATHSIFLEFTKMLSEEGYTVKWDVLHCELFGVPQKRRRLVLMASLLGEAMLPDQCPDVLVSVKEAIGHLPAIAAGSNDKDDSLHCAAGLSELNLKRMKFSRPGGTWRDWPKHLVATCHTKENGKGYSSVYGRMTWDQPSPTITTQCYGFGSGRFGHPVQNRALSLREAALLQSFPGYWEFVPPGSKVHFTKVGRAIGNAVPPKLGEAIGKKLIEIAISNSPLV